MHQAPELIDVLRLIRSENVGPVTFFQLLERFGSPKAALDAIPEMSVRGGREETDRALFARASGTNATVLRRKAGDVLGYPAMLKTIYDPPPVLAVKGNPHLWKGRYSLGMVGTRNASASNYNFARKLAEDVGKHQIPVISGLARGIDTGRHTLDRLPAARWA